MQSSFMHDKDTIVKQTSPDVPPSAKGTPSEEGGNERLRMRSEPLIGGCSQRKDPFYSY
jgi:hypothetical protein